MRRATTFTLAMLLAPAFAQADWLPGGNRIDLGFDFVATTSRPGVVVVAWTRWDTVWTREGSEVRAQAWTADGVLPSGWPAAGVLVSDLPGRNFRPTICEDGVGGVFVAWVNGEGAEWSAHLQHVSAEGSLAAGWPAEGLRLGSVSANTGALVSAHDGAGGVFVGWEEYNRDADHWRAIIHRIDAGGAPAVGWPVGGHSIPNARGLGLVVDGAHYLFVSTAENETETRVRVQRLDGSATPDPAWPQTGALLSDTGYPGQMRLFPDDTGGVFAGWGRGMICVGDGCPPVLRLTARVRSDGTEDDAWIPRPVAYSNAPDETGGMLLAHADGGRPSVVRLGAGRSVMPGWAPGGNSAMTEVVEPLYVLVTADGEGGAFVAWADDRTGDDRLYASRLDAEGRLASRWPATGSVVSTRGNVAYFQLVSLGGGDAVALWVEYSSVRDAAGYLLALHPGEPGPIAGLRPVSIEVGFGVVQVRPNPARGTIVAIVELQDAGPARLDLVDATGRVLETQDFRFNYNDWPPLGRQARGAVHFNQARTLPPGVYWIRVSQGGRRASKKVVVLE